MSREGGWTWTGSHEMQRGLYLLRRAGVDVGTVSLLPDVSHHAVRLAAMCSALDAIDEQIVIERLEAERRHPSNGPG